MPTKLHKKWEYGKSPNPKNWHQTVDAMRSNRKRTKRPDRLMDKLLEVEESLKVKK